MEYGASTQSILVHNSTEGWYHYNVKTLDSNNCINGDTIRIIYGFSGVNLQSQEVKISISPNPSKDFLIWEAENLPQGEILLQLVNEEGKIIRFKTLNNNLGKQKEIIETKGLKSGFYLFKCSHKTFEKSYKIIIEN